jgi:hypothetical protein
MVLVIVPQMIHYDNGLLNVYNVLVITTHEDRS